MREKIKIRPLPCPHCLFYCKVSQRVQWRRTQRPSLYRKSHADSLHSRRRSRTRNCSWGCARVCPVYVSLVDIQSARIDTDTILWVYPWDSSRTHSKIVSNKPRDRPLVLKKILLQHWALYQDRSSLPWRFIKDDKISTEPTHKKRHVGDPFSGSHPDNGIKDSSQPQRKAVRHPHRKSG